MKSPNKLKILNDPVYGFITIPNELIFDLIEHPYFQRLRRITQMGLSYLVYPGAHHTRLHHALGCMYLMQKSVQTLRNKGGSISTEEEEALLAAILLHDIGHGPFSHAMEHSLVKGVSHEHISLLFIEKLNDKFNQSLTMALQIFKGEHPRNFLNQLVSSQLDMDRMDYLRRDSFYTGVTEGHIGSQRLIAMLNVVDDELVVEEKGIYSVEKFLVARRLMYWQVYLHKTGIVAEQLLIKILKRARDLMAKGKELPGSDALLFFLKNEITADNLNSDALEKFSKLDDTDVVSAMKHWTGCDDFVLSELCRMLINRDLLEIKMKKTPVLPNEMEKHIRQVMEQHHIDEEEAAYFVFSGKAENLAYEPSAGNINILYKDGTLKDVAKASDQLNLEALSKPVVKYYSCRPKS